MAYTSDSKSDAARRVGSTPTLDTLPKSIINKEPTITTFAHSPSLADAFGVQSFAAPSPAPVEEPVSNHNYVLAHGLTRVIDAREAITLLQRVVVGNESFIYRDCAPGSDDVNATCKYVRGDAASCLVGKALALAGVPLNVLAAFDSGPFTAGASGLGKYLPITERALRVFSEAQNVQDSHGATWGAAVTAALGAYLSL